MDQTQYVDDEIRNLMAGILDIAPSQIDGEALLVQDLGMDSMMALEIVTSIERKYKVKLPDAELANVKTLNSVVEIVKRYAR